MPRHACHVAVRWSDMDAYGHVNNAVYLTYLEECRDRLVEGMFAGEAWDFVLAHVGVDYRSELTREDGSVVVECEVVGFGASSVRTRERIVAADGRLAAEGESVIVPRDPQTGRSRPLTDGERATLQRVLDAGG